MKLTPEIWSNENKLRSVFSWLTKSGAGRKFGSLPIGWYQMHQCKAVDVLIITGASEFKYSKASGGFMGKFGHKWKWLFSAIELFQQADNLCRK